MIKIKKLIILFISYIYLIKFNSKANNQKYINIKDENVTFGIISYECKYCGLFSIFNKNLKCILSTIERGIIPIVDLTNKPNIFNRFNNFSSKINPWELFFNQPFDFHLKDVKDKSKNIINVNCKYFYRASYNEIYNNKVLRYYWKNIMEKYAPIKKEIFLEAKRVETKILKNSKNVLGILMRGTDFINTKPKYHFIPPTFEMVFEDVKILEKKNQYEYIFLTTEDETLRNKFINKFNNKIKYFKNNFEIKYDYKNKLLLAEKNIITGNLDFVKTYLINIIILSHCLDILSAKTNGAAAAFMLSNGFRFSKVYDLGRFN